MRNITRHIGRVTRQAREENTIKRRNKGAVFWLTGLSGSGKSTVAYALEHALFSDGCACAVLDGDNVRHGLCSDIGFSDADRHENLRRVGEVAKLFLENGNIVICSFISPYREDREMVRGIMPHGDFYEVFIDAPLSVCEERDPKGLYKLARDGKIPDFTGVDSPYEVPINPDIRINTEKSLDLCVKELLKFVHS